MSIDTPCLNYKAFKCLKQGKRLNKTTELIHASTIIKVVFICYDKKCLTKTSKYHKICFGNNPIPM